MIPCCPAIILEATFPLFFQSNLSTFHSNLFGFRFFACTHSGFHHPPGLPMPPKPDWHTPYPPPGLVPPPPHPPQSTLSRFFVVSPVKTGTHSKIPEFSLPCALGLHSHHPPTLPRLWPHLCTLPRTSAHTCTPFRAFCAPP